MTTPDRTEDLLRLMLERRAGTPAPGWLLAGVSEQVRATPQARGGFGVAPRSAWRGGRLALVAAAALLLVAIAAGALVAAGIIVPEPPPQPQPEPTARGLVVVPAPSASAGHATPEPTDAVRPSSSPPGLTPTSNWTLPVGWHYDLACDSGPVCSLHLYDEAGREQEGWPVAIRGRCESGVTIGPDESAFVACTHDHRAVITGLDRSGKALPGWPVRLRGSVAEGLWNDFGVWGGGPSSVAVGPDGAVYVAVGPARAGAPYAIHAFSPDATPRDGWPRSLRGDWRGFTVAAGGAILAWWYEGVGDGLGLSARRTVYTMIGPDGRTLPGWPRGSKGAASGPVGGDDGSVFYVSASGKVWGHDRSGEIIAGWPYQLPYPIAPALRPDDALIFIDSADVVVLDHRGRAVPGWPFHSRTSLEGPGCDADGSARVPSAMTADGRLYLAAWDGRRASIIALGADGRTPSPWPYRVPAGWRVSSLAPNADGTISVGLTGDPICGYGIDDTTIRLTAGGELAGEGPPTPLSGVYRALRLEPPYTTTGSDTFAQGDPIVIKSSLDNRSSSPVTLPLVVLDEHESYYAAGTVQTWIERLGLDRTIDCLPRAGRKGAWYATGGWVNVTSIPQSIQPGGTVDMLFEASLWSDLTRCLPAGRYRYHIEYKPINSEARDVIDEASIDLTITETSTSTATPTPGPTPIATPKPTPVPTTPQPTSAP